MGKVKKYHPMIDIIVACEMAGHRLSKIAGELQERHNSDLTATEWQVEAIEQAGNNVLAALAKFTSR